VITTRTRHSSLRRKAGSLFGAYFHIIWF